MWKHAAVGSAEPKKVEGAQSLRRALTLIRLIGKFQVQGLTIAELAAHSSLSRPTIHRLAASLVEEGFLDRDTTTRRFHLGAELFRLGVHFFDHVPLTDDYIYAARRIALETEDTAVLGVREGDNWYCLHREDGKFPGNVLSTNVGARHLLGITAGGLAIMALLPDREIERLLTTYAADYKRAKLTASGLLQGIAATRRLGYARSTNEVTPGVGSVGVAFRLQGDTQASIAVGTTFGRLSPARCENISLLIRREVQATLFQFNGAGGPSPAVRRPFLRGQRKPVDNQGTAATRTRPNNRTPR